MQAAMWRRTGALASLCKEAVSIVIKANAVPASGSAIPPGLLSQKSPPWVSSHKDATATQACIEEAGWGVVAALVGVDVRALGPLLSLFEIYSNHCPGVSPFTWRCVMDVIPLLGFCRCINFRMCFSVHMVYCLGGEEVFQISSCPLLSCESSYHWAAGQGVGSTVTKGVCCSYTFRK